jgi:hypothetical protein
MTGSKGLTHWTSETVNECSEITGSQQTHILLYMDGRNMQKLGVLRLPQSQNYRKPCFNDSIVHWSGYDLKSSPGSLLYSKLLKVYFLPPPTPFTC